MMSIDWSKAPHDATHWEPRSSLALASWMRLNGKLWYFWVDHNGGEWRVTSSVNQLRIDNMIQRPPVWDGTGVPPIGCECFYKHRQSIDDAFDEPERVVVLAIDDDGFAAIRGKNLRIWVQISELIPIITETQYYSKIRNDGIQKMLDFTRISSDENEIKTQREVCANLWDAGYRMPGDTTIPYHDLYPRLGSK